MICEICGTKKKLVKFYTNYQGKLLPIPERKKRVLPSIDAGPRKQVFGEKTIWNPVGSQKKGFYTNFQGKFIPRVDADGISIRKYRPRSFHKLTGEAYGVPRGLKKAPRTVAGMDKYDWTMAGAAGGMGATGYAVGKYDEEIGEHIKGNIKAHVKTGDAAIDVIKERRDQLLRKLGII